MYNLPKFICFTGIDGSGKTTYCNLIQKELKNRGIDTKYIWMRMNYFLTRPVLLFCRIVGLTKRPVIQGKKTSIHEFHKSPIVAKIVQYLHLIDTFITYFFKIFIPSLRNKDLIFICDRYIYDILIDFAVESKDKRIFEKRISRILKKIIIPNSRFYLVQTSKQKIFKRRPEVRLFDPDFDLRYSMYTKLSKFDAMNLLNNNLTLQENVSFLIRDIGIN